MMPLKILLLDAPIGNGHKQAAITIGKALTTLQPDCIVRFFDVFSCVPAWLMTLCLRSYMCSLALLPQCYARLYAWGNDTKTALYARQLMSAWLARQLKKVIIEFSPDAVICTHAAPAAAAAYLLSHTQLRFYHAGIVTDFVIHRLWLNTKVDDYFVADERLITAKLRALIPAKRFHPLGIPTLVVNRKTSFIPVLNAGNRKIVLIMGGGEGLLPMPALLAKLNTVSMPLQLIFLTGNQQIMRGKLRKMASESCHLITILPFVPYVGELMAKADVLISKAGGLSMSEALCAGLPILLYRPLPGQERANADFLLSAGAAREIVNIDDIPTIIDEIFRIDNNKLLVMKNQAKLLARPEAAVQIAKYILNKLCN